MTTFSQLIDKAKQGNSYWESKARHKFAIRLAETLKERGISQAEYAKLADVSAGYISRVLAGNENLSVRTLVKLTRALDLEFDIEIHSKAPVFHQLSEDASPDWSLLQQAFRRQHGSPQLRVSVPMDAVNENTYCSSAVVGTGELMAAAA